MTLKIATPHIVLKIALFLLLFSVQINAQTATSYNFNTAGQLSSLFNGVGQVGSVSQLTTGGISNSGGINLPSGANAIFSTKEDIAWDLQLVQIHLNPLFKVLVTVGTVALVLRQVCQLALVPMDIIGPLMLSGYPCMVVALYFTMELQIIPVNGMVLVSLLV